MKLAFVLSVIVLVTKVYFVSAYNILGVFIFPFRSSVQTFEPLFQKLTENGHHLTLISNFQLKGFKKNYNEILLAGASVSADKDVLSNLEKVPQGRLVKYLTPIILSEMSKTVCSMLFSSDKVQALLKNHTKFDLAIMHVFQTDCVYQISQVVDCPVIGVHSSIMMSWTTDRFGLPKNPAYIPNNFMPSSDKMNFWERLDNTAATWFHSLYYKYVTTALDKRNVEKYFSDKETSELDLVVHNTSLFMSNTHYSINLPRPLVPNVIEIGGIHIGQTKALPQVIW